ncbi:MAG: PqqD family protein [Candidatus Promineifilaceae bacterium]|jgi:hypothetical protein
MKNDKLTVQSMDLTSKVFIPDNVLFRKLEEESILLNLDDEMYYGLDEIGTHMLVALESSESINAASSQLLTEFNVDSDQLREDLLELIVKLLEHKLIIVSKM